MSLLCKIFFIGCDLFIDAEHISWHHKRPIFMTMNFEALVKHISTTAVPCLSTTERTSITLYYIGKWNSAHAVRRIHQTNSALGKCRIWSYFRVLRIEWTCLNNRKRLRAIHSWQPATLPTGNETWILFCTEKEDTLVKYATAGLVPNIFVQKYMIELPSEEEIKEFIASSNY